MTAMLLPFLNLLSLCASLKIDEVAQLEMGEIGPVRDMTLAGFLTMALKLLLIKTV